MCTLVILRRPGNAWPLLLAANRDEMRRRKSMPPARHWPDRPEVVAGLDRTGGGSWLGMNEHGLVAAVMNREDSLGPAPGKRSRGELVLEALEHTEAEKAAGALADLNPDAYRAFNLVIADAQDAFWVRHGGDGEIRVHAIPPGLHMLSATELDDLGYPRIRTHLERFRAAAIPKPEQGRWEEWKDLLATRAYSEEAGPTEAMNLELTNGFGTVSSALIGVPAYPVFASQPQWLHAEGPPDCVPFEVVNQNS
ncbi:MAG: NRDE family protein [Chromatiaceae bacterium]|nr:NRDE family protein [Chromatiaceae bacterium]